MHVQFALDKCGDGDDTLISIKLVTPDKVFVSEVFVNEDVLRNLEHFLDKYFVKRSFKTSMFQMGVFSVDYAGGATTIRLSKNSDDDQVVVGISMASEEEKMASLVRDFVFHTSDDLSLDFLKQIRSVNSGHEKVAKWELFKV